jgi:hypothetical protein
LLKPAHEVWWLVQKPGLAESLNIDACQVGTGGDKGIWPITDREGRVTMNSAEDGSFNTPQETDNTMVVGLLISCLHMPQIAFQKG